jgi:hypothetical protein
MQHLLGLPQQEARALLLLSVEINQMSVEINQMTATVAESG